MKSFKLISGLLISIIVVIVTVKVINYIPYLIQKDSMRRYNSIEEVKKNLKIKDLYTPTFFPEGLVWPPSNILAQGEPFLTVILEFNNSKNSSTDLIICQSASEKFKYNEKIRIKNMIDRINYSFKGRNISILTFSCEDGIICTNASWKEDKYTITVIARFEPPQLLKIIESMIH